MDFLTTLSIAFTINVVNGFWRMKKRPVDARLIVALTIESLGFALFFAFVFCSNQFLPGWPVWMAFVAAFLCVYVPLTLLSDRMLRGKT